MIGTAKITSKGQVTLPKKVRKRLNVDTGDTIIFEYVGGQLIIRRARNIEKYFNSLPPMDISKEKIEEMIAADIRREQ
jgi:AbrB family looped-hinge helix DNA binding protein